MPRPSKKVREYNDPWQVDPIEEWLRIVDQARERGDIPELGKFPLNEEQIFQRDLERMLRPNNTLKLNSANPGAIDRTLEMLQRSPAGEGRSVLLEQLMENASNQGMDDAAAIFNSPPSPFQEDFQKLIPPRQVHPRPKEYEGLGVPPNPINFDI